MQIVSRPGANGAEWLLHGPTRTVGHTDLWQLLSASLSNGDDRSLRLVCDDLRLTAPALIEATDALSQLPPSCFVGIHLPRSAAMVAAVLAVWRAGSTYLPLPCEFPAPRIEAIVRTCRPEIVVTQAGHDLFPDHAVLAETVCLGLKLTVLVRRGTSPTAATRRACYVAHTSGSTGASKSILVSHRALLNRLASLIALAFPAAADTVLFKTSLAFDVHVWEFVLPLATGARLVIYPQARYFDLGQVADLLASQSVTLAGFVPQLLDSLLDRPAFRARSRLRLVFCGGEGWTPRLARRFHECLPGCTLRNSYGPAETTLAVANWLVPKTPPPDAIELGEPLDNTTFLIEELSRDGGQILGHLCIGGPQVADGYVDATLNAPFYEDIVNAKPTPFYRTGDLVALDTTTGALHFRGRRDQQIKLNGVRIELAEIEAAMTALDGVTACVVSLGPFRPSLPARALCRRSRPDDRCRSRAPAPLGAAALHPRAAALHAGHGVRGRPDRQDRSGAIGRLEGRPGRWPGPAGPRGSRPLDFRAAVGPRGRSRHAEQADHAQAQQSERQQREQHDRRHPPTGPRRHAQIGAETECCHRHHRQQGLLSRTPAAAPHAAPARPTAAPQAQGSPR